MTLSEDQVLNTREAISAYDEAIRLKPDYAAAYNDRGVEKYKLGDYQSALADWDEAIRLEPAHAAAYTLRGAAKYKLGQVREAKIDFYAALRLAEAADEYSLKAKIEQLIQALDG